MHSNQLVIMLDDVLGIKTFDVNFNLPICQNTRDLRALELPNGIFTLLISDPSEDWASGALCVATGSHHDPNGIPGLAHFCEHMVFLGTKQFPGASYFLDVISKAGGDHNAFTCGEKTCFYFEVPMTSTKIGSLGIDLNKNTDPSELVFNHTLQVFANLFKSPTFNDSLCKQEAVVIDEEHALNVTDPEKILYHGMRLLANKEHPFSRFGTGNSDTLLHNPKSLRTNPKSALTDFFSHNYTPNRMALVIRGPQSINLLTKMALINFSDITNNGYEDVGRHRRRTDVKQFKILHDTWEKAYTGSIYGRRELGKCLYIMSEGDSRLRFLFPCNGIQEDFYFDMYMLAWISLLGDESDGTLCYKLIKEENLASSVTLLCEELGTDNYALVLDLHLTEEGERNISKIISLLFKFIYNSIIKCPLKRMARYLLELSVSDSINFIYRQTQSSPMEETSKVAESLLSDFGRLELRNIMKGYNSWDDEINDGTDPKKLWQLKAFNFIERSKMILSMVNFNLIIKQRHSNYAGKLSHEHSQQPLSLVKDEFYGFSYDIFPLDVSRILKDTVNCGSCILFPESNINLADNFAYAAKNNTSHLPCRFVTKKATISTISKLVDYSKVHEIWLKEESRAEFAERLFVSLRLQSIAVECSPEAFVCNELLAEIIGDILRHKLYHAETLGYTWALFPNLNGTVSFGVEISGLKRGFRRVYKTVINVISNIIKNVEGCLSEALPRAKMAIENMYLRLQESKGISKLSTGLLVLLEENTWPLDERRYQLELLDLSTLSNYCHSFLVGLKYTCLFVQGMAPPATAIDLYSDLDTLGCKDQEINFISQRIRVLEPLSFTIPPGKILKLDLAGSSGDYLSSVYYFIQMGHRKNDFDVSMTRLFSSLLQSHSQSYLRTKRNLAYDVCSGLREFRSSIGLFIALLSKRHQHDMLVNEIFSFIKFWEKTLKSYSRADFNSKVLKPYKLYLNSENDYGELYGNDYVRLLTPLKESNTASSNVMCKNHRIHWERIISEHYSFFDINEDKYRTAQDINTLTKEEFLKLFNDKISPDSLTSSVIILSNSPGGNEELIKTKKSPKLVNTPESLLPTLSGFKGKKDACVKFDLNVQYLPEEEALNFKERKGNIKPKSPKEITKSIFKSFHKERIKSDVDIENRFALSVLLTDEEKRPLSYISAEDIKRFQEAYLVKPPQVECRYDNLMFHRDSVLFD